MKKPLLQCLLIWVYFCETAFLIGQTLPLRHYNVTDGLASSFVTEINQDSQGFLWIGTQRGVSQFDGIQFKNFNTGEWFVNDYIEDILVDRVGRVWFATFSGCVVYEPGARKEWRVYTMKDGLIDQRVRVITEDPGGNIWIGTVSGVSRFDGETFTSFKYQEDLARDFISDILFDRDGRVWFATSRGVVCIDGGRFIRYTTAQGLSHNQVNVLLVDRQGNIWIGTDRGLKCLRSGQQELSDVGGKNDRQPVQALLEDRYGNVWVGTVEELFHFASDKLFNTGGRFRFSVGNISSIFEDNEGNIWFGTSSGLRKIQFLRIVNFTDMDGLPSNLIWSILQDEKGRYWFGTGKGLSCLSEGKFKTYTTADGLGNDNIYALAIDQQGNIWIGTGNGLAVFSSGKIRNYRLNNIIADPVVISLMVDRRGWVWVGTIKGMCRWDGRRFGYPGFKMDEVPVHCFLEDREGSIWYSDTGGVCRVKNLGEEANPSITRFSTREGILYAIVNSLFQDSQGRIWMTSMRGLSCFNNGAFANYTTADGLADDACYFVMEDQRGDLWIGTGRGVCRFNGTSFKTYTVWDGLASYEMNQGSCLKDRQGYLWFGTVNGVSRFDPRVDQEYPVPPPVYISQFEVLGEPYQLSTTLERGIQARLKYYQNYIHIGFVGISLTSPEAVEYHYRLDPIDRGWSKSRERSAGYPYLPPGDYRFRVRAVNQDGVRSTRAAEIHFVILPPFWKTIWFQIVVAILILGIGVMFFFWRMKRMRERVELRERNKQLIMAQKMELLGILAGGAVHDLKNLLAVIIAYSKLAERQARNEETGGSDNALERIKTTAVTAVQIVKQILAFTRQNYDKTMTANLPDLVDDILEILKVTAPGAIKIDWVRPVGELRLAVNPTRFQQVVMNLCLNAIDAMPSGGRLEISLVKEPGQIVFRVKDTGIGMEESVRQKIFDPLFTTKKPGKGTGLGLFVVKQIIEEIRGKIDVVSFPGEGTTFTIAFPETVLSL